MEVNPGCFSIIMDKFLFMAAPAKNLSAATCCRNCVHQPSDVKIKTKKHKNCLTCVHLESN